MTYPQGMPKQQGPSYRSLPMTREAATARLSLSRPLYMHSAGRVQNARAVCRPQLILFRRDWTYRGQILHPRNMTWDPCVLIDHRQNSGIGGVLYSKGSLLDLQMLLKRSRLLPQGPGTNGVSKLMCCIQDSIKAAMTYRESWVLQIQLT